ncbi:hypothetical protein C8R43DRAFT_1089712 [Mycena crocata]|nr:hypothetical protein C8R43DRAFT_1089712 [Mycena crocata]
MDSAKLVINQAHGSGFTCLAFSRDGSRAFTGGDDCIVRIWKVAEGSEQEPATAVEAEKAITSISPADDCWLSASADSDVRRYVKDTGEFEGLVTSTRNTEARCVALDPRGKTVAVACDEDQIRLINLDDPLQLKMLKKDEHRSAVRKVTWHPTGALLTSCGSDGQIIVWDVTKDEPTQEVKIPGIIPTVKQRDEQGVENVAFFHDCSAIWHPSGDYFFVISRSRHIVTVQRSDWKQKHTFSGSIAQESVTALALSPNGAYLVSASPSMVHVWSTETRQVVSRQVLKHNSNIGTIITQLAFSPTENLIAWTTTGGVFARWPNAIPATLPDPVKPLLEVKGPAEVVGDAAMFDSDEEDAVHIEVDMDIGKAEDDALETLDNLQEDARDWMEDDDEEANAGGEFVKEMVSITKAQPPFQPGATPMFKTKQYLAINRIGHIEVTAVPSTTTSASEHLLIDVKFYDETKRKSFHFTELRKFNLGDLGERGALFACSPDNDHPAQVYYRPYGSDSSKQEWKYELRRNCRVLGVTAGGLSPSGSTKHLYGGDLDGFGNIVIATTDGDLTFLSGTGRERRIMGLGGDFVSMVAGHEWVFVVHRAGSTTIDGSQNLSYTLINFDDFSVRQRDFLPIPKRHILKWIGITEEGAPAMYDSTGRIHVLTKYRTPHHASWARVMDTNLLERRTGKDESYWPIGIHSSTLMCIILKGTEEYPRYPLPFHAELPIEIPFRSVDKAEEKLERDTVFLEILRDGLDDQLTNEEISRGEQEMDKEILQLIKSACSDDKIPRAIELAKLIHRPIILDAAIKISVFYSLSGLTEKFRLLKKIREESEDRLMLARDKRMQWTRPDPLPRSLSSGTDSVSSRPKPFQDFGPPPAVLRPGLAPAIPVKETTRYTTNASADLPPASSREFPSGSPPENKRKRDEVDDMSASLDFVAPPKQKLNPFARKVGQDGGRNAFARKTESNKTIQKSDSFFDKVDAVEVVAPKSKRSNVSKPKDKEKKDGPRQTTLFGMMTSAKKSRETVTDNQPDVTMSDATLVETQPELPEEWEETQPVDPGLEVRVQCKLLTKAEHPHQETQPATP